MERLIVKVGRNYLFVKVRDIDLIESEGNYLRLHLGNRSYLLRHTMCGIEKKLNSKKFVRINRSTIVNVERIKELRSVSNYNYQVVLEDERTWMWGRRYRSNLLRLITGN